MGLQGCSGCGQGGDLESRQGERGVTGTGCDRLESDPDSGGSEGIAFAIRCARQGPIVSMLTFGDKSWTGGETRWRPGDRALRAHLVLDGVPR